MSDSKNSLLDIADQAGLLFGTIHKAAGMLEDHGLLKAVGGLPIQKGDSYE